MLKRVGALALCLVGCGSSSSPETIDASNDEVDASSPPSPWRLVHADGFAGAPGERHGHAMVWDDTRLIFWGTPITGSSDLWWFDPTSETWLQRISGGTPGVPGNAHGVGLVWDGTRVLLWGGANNGTYAYSPSDNTWTELIAPAAAGSPEARIFATLVWTGSEALMFGGLGGVPSHHNDVWSYSPIDNAWTELVPDGDPSAPAARQAHVAVWTGSRMLIHGGHDATTFGFSDLWSFDPATTTWTLLDPTGGGPGGRYHHEAAWTGTELVVLGGAVAGAITPNDVWHYDPASNTWRQAAAPGSSNDIPPARLESAFVWAGARGYLYGGCGMVDGCFALGDLWEYTPGPAP